MSPWADLRWSDPEGETQPPRADRRVMARSFAYLYGLGALVLFITLALPGADDRNELLVAAVGVTALTVPVLMGLRFDRLPAWVFEVLPMTGALLVTVAAYAGGSGAASAYSMFYLWVILTVFYFFSARLAYLNLVLVAIAYAGLLGAEQGGELTVLHWTMTVATLLVAGALIAALLDKVDGLLARLDAKIEEAEWATQIARQHSSDLRAIGAVSRELSASSDPQAARPAICHAAVDVAGGMTALLYEPDGSGRGLVRTAAAPADFERSAIPFLGPPSGAVKAFSSGESFFVSDFRDQPLMSRELVALTGAASGVWQPILRDGITRGVLTVLWSDPVPELPKPVAMTLELLAAEAAAVIERSDLLERLQAVARTDELTGLPNRRAWDEEISREIARAARDGRPLAIAMLDLDRFKDFNDEHGHPAGDRLLKEAAGMWRGRLRTIDFIARYGGEEFTLALPGCPLDEAMRIAERVRVATPHGATCSIGVTAWDGEESPEALVERADAALYRAKAGGRDRAAV